MSSTRALLCFDGSEDAAAAIREAGELLGARPATVLTVWEPAATWAAYDPATALSGSVAGLASQELGLDQIAEGLAAEALERGVAIAREARFDAVGELGDGKPWRVICERAEQLGAAPIVIGARGLSRVQSLLLGSVSAAVVAHAKRAVLVVPASGGVSDC